MAIGVRSRRIVLAAAAAIPLVALLGTGLWSQRGVEESDARRNAAGAARAVAAKIDRHFGELEYLLQRLGAAVSTDPGDVERNDALLRGAKSGQPGIIANIFLLARDGSNIGNAVGQHAAAGDREYFQRAMAGAPLVVGQPIRSRSNLGWVVPVARPLQDGAGEIRAVLAAATYLDGFRDVIDVDELPPGSVVRIVRDDGTEVTTIARDGAASAADPARAGEAASRRNAGGEAATADAQVAGFARTRRASWLITVALPADAAAVRLANGR
jgi:Cache domain